MTDEPLLRVNALSKFYGSRIGCAVTARLMAITTS